ncbi:MAG: glycosyltransferase family 2 protein [Ginsengibacter sp.]
MLKEQSLVSVIIPCYNYAHFLPEALECVMAQTYADWECVIINDGSTDNTEEVALKYCEAESRFKYLYKENGGHSSARNLGIRHSKGVYILPLDSDDKISSYFLERAVKEIESDNEIKLVCAETQLFGATEKIVKLPKYDFRELLICNYLFATNLFRRKDFDMTYGYDEQMLLYEDWSLWINLLKNGGRVVEMPFVGYYYRQKTDSIFAKGQNDKKRMFQDLLRHYYRNIDIYEKYFENPVFLIQENEKMNRVIKAYQQSLTYRMSLRIHKIKEFFFRK